MKVSKNPKFPLWRLLSYLKPYWRISVFAMIMIVASVVADLVIPRLIQSIVDQGIALGDVSLISNTALLIITLALIEAVMTIGNTVLSVRASQGLATDIRSVTFRKIQSFSFANLDKFQTGQLVIRLTSDVSRIQMMVLMGLRIFVRAPLMIIGSIILMVMTSIELALMMLVLLPLTLVFTFVFVVKAQPMFLEVQRRLDKLNMVLQEYLAGVRVVKAFVRSNHEEERFRETNLSLTKQTTKISQLLSILIPTMFLVINISVLVIVWFGGQQVIMGKFSVGQILAFINYLLSSLFPLLILSFMASGFSAANASAQRICEVIDTQPQVQDRPDAKHLANPRGRVVFENVCFSYSENCVEPVLNEINLTAEPGQTVALLGATGSGKSTLVNLIPRFYDVTKGKVTIDGIDVRDVTLESLRKNIGIALQETVLFSGTVIDNIRYGRPEATEDEVIVAAKAAEAHDFIMSFPDGYKSIIGQRGINLSGGQKQRISIARALLIQPKILILDDSTSSVDIQTESRIQKQLKNMMKECTSFIIAQRISTVLRADKTVVLERGRIVAEGAHNVLLRKSPIYREIFDSQMGGGPNVE